MRIPVLEAAGERCVPLVAMTFVSVDPHDLATFEQFEAILRQLLPVFLQCLTAEVVTSASPAPTGSRKKWLRSRAFAPSWLSTKSVRSANGVPDK